MMVYIRAFIVLLVGILFIMGCGKKAEEKVVEKMIEKQTGGKANVDLSKGTMEIETKDGKMTMTSGKAAKVPDDFPSDVYLYKPASVEAAIQVPNGHSVSLMTEKNVSQVSETYKKKMTGEGWSQQAAMDMGTQSVLIYEKNDRVTNITIVPDNGKTRIQVTVSNK